MVQQNVQAWAGCIQSSCPTGIEMPPSGGGTLIVYGWGSGIYSPLFYESARLNNYSFMGETKRRILKQLLQRGLRLDLNQWESHLQSFPNILHSL